MNRRNFITTLPLVAIPAASASPVLPAGTRWLVQATPSQYVQSEEHHIGEWDSKTKFVVSPRPDGRGIFVSIAVTCEAWVAGQYYDTVTRSSLTLTGGNRNRKTGELIAWITPASGQSNRFTRTVYSGVATRTTETATVIISSGLTRTFHSAVATGRVQVHLRRYSYIRDLAGEWDFPMMVKGYPKNITVGFTARIDSIQVPI
jgi:hypothetical protein